MSFLRIEDMAETMPVRRRASRRRMLLALALFGALAAAGCEEETKSEDPSLSLSLSPARLNLAQISQCQADPSVNSSILTASVTGVDGEAQVVFQVDTDAMLTQLPEPKDRGAGGFLALGAAPGSIADPPQNMPAQVGDLGQAQVQFNCTAEGKVAVRAQELIVGLNSEVKWITCEYRNPNDYQFSLEARDASTMLGETNPLEVSVNDGGHAGTFVKGASIIFKADHGGTFEPDQAATATRGLSPDETLGLGVISSPVAFRCPTGADAVARYPVTVEFVDKNKYCSATARTFVNCLEVPINNDILFSVDNDKLEADSTEFPNPLRNRTQLSGTLYGPETAEPDRELRLTTDKGGFILPGQESARTPVTVTTDSNGQFAVTFVGKSEPGTATITGSTTLTARTDEEVALYGPTGIKISATTQVKIIGATSLEYVGSAPTVLGVRGSGFNESARVSFKVLGSDGNPFPPGLSVKFDIASNAGQASLTQSTGETDELGEVYTILNSGKQAANITVRATVQQNGISAESQAIPIIGVHPSWSGFALACDVRNIGAFMDTDGINSRVMQDVPCRTRLLDRFGNPVGLSSAVTFRSEAGSISGSVSSVPQQFDTSGTGGSSPSPEVGNVVALFNTFGVLPMDVPRDGVSETVLDPTHPDVNPRDGLVTIMAFVAGEEAFTDENGNGEYDDGEQFVDLAEPFVDYNDNSERDSFEPFIDLPDADGLYDGVWSDGNRQWDRNTTIWTETRMMYSGSPIAGLPYDQRTSGRTGLPLLVAQNELDDGCLTLSCPQFSDAWFLLAPGDRCDMMLQFLDARGNVLNGSATYQAETEGGGATITLQGPGVKGDQLGLGWKLEKDCGADGTQTTCFVRSLVSAYSESRADVPLGCLTDPVRRLGHLHWAELVHPDPFDPILAGMSPEQLEAATEYVPVNLTYTTTLRVSPDGGNAVSSYRFTYGGAIKKLRISGN